MITLKNLRDEHNHMTQKTLATFLHVDRSVISKWESGKLNPDYEQIERMANLFKKPLGSMVQIFIQAKKRANMPQFEQITIDNMEGVCPNR